VSKAVTQGDNPSKPSQRHSGPPEEGHTGTIHIVELLETPAMTVDMLRARSGYWFQRLQMEAIGIQRHLEPESEADRRPRDR
jgi:hypothetical protein